MVIILCLLHTENGTNQLQYMIAVSIFAFYSFMTNISADTKTVLSLT